MGTLNKTKAGYFTGHKDVKELYFCSDGLAYFTQGAANSHAAALKKNKQGDEIEHYTREEAEAWLTDYAPKYAKECADNANEADKKLATAKAALDKLPASASAAKKAPFLKEVSTAQKAVDAAYAALSAANASAKEIADRTALRPAEAKLKADLSAPAPDAAAIAADKDVINAAAAKVEAENKKKK